MITPDQRRVLGALQGGAVYVGALPLVTDLAEPRLRVVLGQLSRRGLVELIQTPGSTYRLTYRITMQGVIARRSDRIRRGG